MGDNVVAAIPAFAEHLSLEAAQNLPPASPATSNSVYFDLCGLWMISYRASAARWLHGSVLPLVLLFPPPGVHRAAMAKVAGICLLSMLSCLALPAAVGGLRAILSGGVSARCPQCVLTGQNRPAVLCLPCFACFAVLAVPYLLCWGKISI